MNRLLTLLLAGLASVVLAAQQSARPAAQPAVGDQPSVTFRAEANYVEVDAFVTDRDGKPVTDLKTDDFDVREDGAPQAVAAFSYVNIPVERAERALFAPTAVEMDVQTNEGAEGRIYLIVLDDMNTDLSRGPRVKEAVRRFLTQRFGTNDLAAVVYTGGRSIDNQDFTNNQRLLLAAVDKFSGHKLPPATIEKIQGTRRVRVETQEDQGARDLYAPDREYRARSVLKTIRTLAEFMAGVRGRRKAMLLFGEGIDYDVQQVIGPAEGVASTIREAIHEAIATATRGNVSIYAIDPRGLMNGDEDLISVPGTYRQGDRVNGGAVLRVPEMTAQTVRYEVRLQQDSLRAFAQATGGFAVVNQNQFSDAFERIVAENSSYYMLGYYAANGRRSGAYRKIEVRMKRPGLRVRSRNGYYEARGPRAEEAPSLSAMAAAVASPLPTTGIPLRVFAAPFKAAAANATVNVPATVRMTIEMDPTRLSFVEKEGTFEEQVEFTSAATDNEGKIFQTRPRTVKLVMDAATYQRVMKDGLRARLLSEFTLPPGRYQLRVAVGNRAGRAGSVLYEMEIPDFGTLPLSMSGVTIASAADAPTTDPSRAVALAPVTARREFTRGDTLALAAEVYEAAAVSANTHTLDLRAELRADGGRVVRGVSERFSSTELTGPSGTYTFRPTLPLTDLAPGLYVVHVEARARTGAAAMRDIQIRIK